MKILSAKIKGLTTDMIGKLKKEVEDDANEKALCDEEMAKTWAKKQDLEASVELLPKKTKAIVATLERLKDQFLENKKDLDLQISGQSLTLQCREVYRKDRETNSSRQQELPHTQLDQLREEARRAMMLMLYCDDDDDECGACCPSHLEVAVLMAASSSMTEFGTLQEHGMSFTRMPV